MSEKSVGGGGNCSVAQKRSWIHKLPKGYFLVCKTFQSSPMLIYERQEKRLNIMFQPATTYHLLRKKRCSVKEVNLEKLDKAASTRVEGCCFYQG